MPDHYFAPAPGSDDRTRDLRVRVLGRELDVTTSSGVFSGDGLDHATAVLLAELASAEAAPERVLDLGCGWGPLTLALGLQWPESELWAVDVNERALDLTAANTARHEVTARVGLPDDVPADLRFDAIWSNPPIRIGKQALHELLLHWLARLSPTGTLTMVVGKNLGADSLQRWLGEQGWPTERLASSRGFRVLRTSRP
ncbi:class I SAM-dependent methyltransferase [Aeromicrobium alkaliterrae]|uniref:Methyltransferase n=1 Tax=Aeromicrobium alkaliterrae TaxID=302168 RepID=A0ABN2KCM0_9ACTN